MGRLSVCLILFASTVSALIAAPPAGLPSALILADETVRFDGARPLFTANQIANCSEPTRDGLARWAATAKGRKILDRLGPEEYAVLVVEDPAQTSPGRAPQPGIATLASAGDHSKLKVYEIFVNPAVFHPIKATIAVAPPLTAGDMMALAWAAEMLHVDFYARGISLPHHRRDDFQSEWAALAAELRMPAVPHNDESDEVPARDARDWRDGHARSRPRQ